MGKALRHAVVSELEQLAASHVDVSCTGDARELGTVAEQTAHQEAIASFLSSKFCLLLPGELRCRALMLFAADLVRPMG